MANIMTKSGSQDNILTYEHICDTTADMANIERKYKTLGSTCIVITGESGGLEVYIADQNGEWKAFESAGSGGSLTPALSLHICTEEEVDEGMPNIAVPEENTVYFVPTQEEENNLYTEYIYVGGEWEKLGGAALDLSNYATKAELPTNVSDLTNDAGYLTQHQDISGKANSADLATVATSGSYDDLSNKPTIPSLSGYATESYVNTAVGNIDLSTKADKNNTVLTGSLSLGRNVSTTTGSNSIALGYNVTASGNYSHGEGMHATASGYASHAEGLDTIAKGSQSHAEGHNAHATGPSSHAEGDGTRATGNYSHAEGYGGTITSYTSAAMGIADHTEGYQTRTESGQPGNHAEGYQTAAIGGASHAEGSVTTASGTQSHAEGGNTTASGVQSHAEGYLSVASNAQAHAEGYQTTASGAQAHAEGNSTIASGNYSHVEGHSTIASGNYSHAEGDNTIAIGTASHVSGKFNIADSYDSWTAWVANTAYKIGDKVKVTTTVNNESITKGYICRTAHTSNSTFGTADWKQDTNMNYAVIVGGGTNANNRKNIYTLDWDGNETLYGGLTFNTTLKTLNARSATGTNSIAIGGGAQSTGANSVAIGSGITASGMSSVAIGGGTTTASGPYSFAMGGGAQATDAYAVAFGGGTRATGAYSCAIGSGCSASGSTSFAVGGNAQAQGNTSVAEGGATIASGGASHVQGVFNIATATYPDWTANTEYVIGDKVQNQYHAGYKCIVANNDATFTAANWEILPSNSDIQFIIGNGIDDNSRSNAFAVYWNGDTKTAGDVYVGCNNDSTGGNKVATEAYVNARIPAPPSSDGTYTLQVTIADGEATYSWI